MHNNKETDPHEELELQLDFFSLTLKESFLLLAEQSISVKQDKSSKLSLMKKTINDNLTSVNIRLS